MSAPSDINAILSPLDSRVDPWNTTAAPAITFTYQFAGSSQPSDFATDFSGLSFTGWTAFTPEEQAAVKSVFDEFASAMNVKFVEVTGSTDPDIDLGKVSLSGEARTGRLFLPFLHEWLGTGHLQDI
jgi:hypothetical protein